jgi:transposase
MAETGEVFDAGAVVVVAGVDTHLDTNMAAALNGIGGELGVKEFPTTAAGYRALLAWLNSLGHLARVGVEGSGSYGAGLARFLGESGVTVVEVDCPNRQNRRRRGKNDPVDALSAARATLSGDASGLAKARNGAVEMIRVLRVARGSARRDRTEALNQMRSLVATAPDELRQQLRQLSGLRLKRWPRPFVPAPSSPSCRPSRPRCGSWAGEPNIWASRWTASTPSWARW